MDVGVRRRGCCGGDVFPEPSFASWSAYGRALLETGPRLKDRLTERSHADVEVHDLRGRSGARMRRELNWWDLAWFGVGAVIGAGIFVLMQPYQGIDADAPFSVAFTAVGMDWAQYIVAFGALKGMTIVLLVNAVLCGTDGLEPHTTNPPSRAGAAAPSCETEVLDAVPADHAGG